MFKLLNRSRWVYTRNIIKCEGYLAFTICLFSYQAQCKINNYMKGKLITFEGIEGSGKSTQVGLLSSKLREERYQIIAIREPGGTRIGEQIRDITHNRENVDLTAVSEAYLMAASRAQLVRESIKPALKEGKIVIADRFVDSSLAYQGYGRNLGQEAIFALNKLALEEVFPDLTFFLDVTPEVGFGRRNGSGKIDRLDLQQKDFYDRVYKGYKEIIRKDRKRFTVIDSTRSINEVRKVIWQKIKEIL
ncbi:dTMP kinase [Candidatus Gottesmanbacteria bacterium CG11_big_fil_rev_8_21_14_0_20_37_11]|uniref:Thymidylate kinase n=1 Tax=Candidatus Gottesmanbacteria bacterium CG11_big_fil_rev_8_21_14_0_20_37_11 TaxID=1974575 RepID=A0A2H0NGK7_9BACT|nr:MAG: dTMP kinase [Candidatus Gottesmanbacteria bacterium CG11_big_fil_rev_8_21_14_0_20_37_11]